MASRTYLHPFWYALCDYCTGLVAWLLFDLLRKQLLSESIPLFNGAHTLYFLLIPFSWVLLFTWMGSYRNLYAKSRAGELAQTATGVCIGSGVLFFLVLANDVYQYNYSYYLTAFLALALIHMLLIYGGRLLLLNTTKKQLVTGSIHFPAAIVGEHEAAKLLHQQASQKLANEGYRIKGRIGHPANHDGQLPFLGSTDQLEVLVQKHNLQLVVLAISKTEEAFISQILGRLSSFDIRVRIQPGMIDILSGSVYTGNVLTLPLVELNGLPMSGWQQNTKRLLDVAVSLTGLILLSPLLLFIAFRVRRSSPGPVLFLQERIGYHGKPFHIVKFRSMYTNAEPEGPRLSSDHDPRITPWGRIMRKWRLDELPQLWNVLTGDMSLVGPRPERDFYIRQLIKRFPYYGYFLKVKPGITSWGMVQFGYAQNIAEMVERARFDLIYIEHPSLLLDLKILLHTLRIIWKGKGK